MQAARQEKFLVIASCSAPAPPPTHAGTRFLDSLPMVGSTTFHVVRSCALPGLAYHKFDWNPILKSQKASHAYPGHRVRPWQAEDPHERLQKGTACLDLLVCGCWSLLCAQKPFCRPQNQLFSRGKRTVLERQRLI